MNETRARALVAEGRYKEADRILPGVIRAFESGSDHALLADALTLQGVVWARLGAHESSVLTLRRAIDVAQDSGAFSNAGLAALTLIEEHGQGRLSETELLDAYRRADELLKDTQDTEDIARLRACARIMGQRLVGARLSDTGFVLPDVVHAYEARFIREALENEQGSISRAAQEVGHQAPVTHSNPQDATQRPARPAEAREDTQAEHHPAWLQGHAAGRGESGAGRHHPSRRR